MTMKTFSRILAVAFALSVPASPGLCLRFAVASDSQLTFDNPLGEPRIFQRFLKDMAAQDPRPAFLLHCGDIITGWTSSPAVLRRQYEVFRGVVRAAPFPVHIALGNHEGYSPESVKMFVKEFGPTYHSFSADGWHFIALDNANPAHYGSLGMEQEAWLKKDLEASRGMKGTFVFQHMPIAADEMEGWLEIGKADRDRLHALFLANNVKAVFQGHVHTYEMGIRDGIRYYITGSSGGPPEGWPPIGMSYDYLLVDADEGYLGVTPRTIEAIEAEEKERAAARPAPVPAPPGTLLDGFEEGTASRWSRYNDLVGVSTEEGKATEGRRSVKMDFDFAVSLWPILMGASSTPWDMSQAQGVSVDVWASPSLYGARGEVPRVSLSIDKARGEALELKKGAWTTLKWDFTGEKWVTGHEGKGKPGPLDRKNLSSVGGLSLNVVSDAPGRKDDWDRKMKGYLLFDNLRSY